MSQKQPPTLEQQFSLRNFETQVKKMSHDQARDFCLLLYEQNLVQTALYRQLLKGALGVGQTPQ